MFGYLQIQKSELLVREFEAYKAVYCGLCKQMGKDYSFLSRFSLSYDCTFYAMLLMSLGRSCSGFRDGRCTFNPLKKCKYSNCENDALNKAAAFSVISVYYKLKDDLKDSGFFRKIITGAVLPFFSHWRKKAAKKYSEIDAFAEEMMRLQSKAESNPECSVDEAAHPTAYMLANVFSLEAGDETASRIYYEFGYHIGRWIYLVDAADDLSEDIKKGLFNPFHTNGSRFSKEQILSILNQSLARAYEAYNLIDIKDFKGILDNMMMMGFPASQNKVIEKLNGGCNE